MNKIIGRVRFLEGQKSTRSWKRNTKIYRLAKSIKLSFLQAQSAESPVYNCNICNMVVQEIRLCSVCQEITCKQCSKKSQNQECDVCNFEVNQIPLDFLYKNFQNQISEQLEKRKREVQKLEDRIEERETQTLLVKCETDKVKSIILEDEELSLYQRLDLVCARDQIYEQIKIVQERINEEQKNFDSANQKSLNEGVCKLLKSKITFLRKRNTEKKNKLLELQNHFSSSMDIRNDLFNQLYLQRIKIKDLILCYNFPANSSEAFESDSDTFSTEQKSGSVSSWRNQNRFHRAPILIRDDDELINVDDRKFSLEYIKYRVLSLCH